jgi:hypothetical protein
VIWSRLGRPRRLFSFSVGDVRRSQRRERTRGGRGFGPHPVNDEELTRRRARRVATRVAVGPRSRRGSSRTGRRRGASPRRCLNRQCRFYLGHLNTYSIRHSADSLLGREGPGSLTIEEISAGAGAPATRAARHPARGPFGGRASVCRLGCDPGSKGFDSPAHPRRSARGFGRVARERLLSLASSAGAPVGLISVCGPGWQGAPFGSGRSAVRIRPHGPSSRAEGPLLPCPCPCPLPAPVVVEHFGRSSFHKRGQGQGHGSLAAVGGASLPRGASGDAASLSTRCDGFDSRTWRRWARCVSTEM